MITYRLADVGDTAALCESVTFAGRDHGRGEWPFPAFVERDPARVAANAVIRGRSCELGLALAALADYEGLDLAANIVATGCLNDETGLPVAAQDGSHAVLPVRQLRAKIEAVRRHARRAGGRWLLLVPSNRLPPPTEDTTRSLAGDEEWHHATGVDAADANVQIVTVGSLLQAARRAFELPDAAFAPTSLWALRGLLERLRQERGGLEPILEACRRLHAATDESHVTGGIALVYRYQALIHAAHALTELDLAGLRPRWRDTDDPTPPRELADRLRAEALALSQVNDGGGGRSDVPADFHAASLHYDACRAHVDTDFEWGLARLEQALQVEGLSREGHSEYRRILGTRAQFRWRQGLRLAALGWESAAERQVERALEDVETILELAPAARHPAEVARARCYRANASIALWWLQPEEERRRAVAGSVEADLLDVLGDRLFCGGDGEAGPSQYPGWGLALLYAWWGLSGRWQQIVAHWLDARSQTGTRWPDAPPPAPGRSLAQLLLDDGPGLYCDLEVASLLAEAGVRCDQPTLLEDASSRMPSPGDRLALPDLLTWAIVALDKRAADFEVSRAIQTWAAGEAGLAVPDVARRGDRLDSRPGELLGRLQRSLHRGDRTRTAAARDALMAWTGRLPRELHASDRGR